MDGWLGRLGGVYRFSGWKDQAERSPSLTLTVAEETEFEAIWRQDVTIPALFVAMATLLASLLWPSGTLWTGLVLTRKPVIT